MPLRPKVAGGDGDALWLFATAKRLGVLGWAGPGLAEVSGAHLVQCIKDVAAGKHGLLHGQHNLWWGAGDGTCAGMHPTGLFVEATADGIELDVKPRCLSLLLLQNVAEGFLPVGDVGCVTSGIDEGIGWSGCELGLFFDHAVVAAMGTEKEVHWQRLEDAEGLLVVGGNAGILFVANKDVAWVHIGAADDDGVETIDLHRPSGAAACVSWREMGGERAAAEFNLVSILEAAIHLGRREAHVAGFESRGEAASIFDGCCVFIHDAVFGVGLFQDFCAACAVVGVGVADEQELHVAEFESELFDAGADERNGFFEAAVDQDVAFRCGDEEGGEVFGADVVEVASDLVRREGLGPVRWIFAQRGEGEEEAEQGNEEALLHVSRFCREGDLGCGGFRRGHDPNRRSRRRDDRGWLRTRCRRR